ncbi:Protein CASPARIAN STRIP INTEGRITY FACTOR 1 [Camellia lanceoleosa]|uniref:Protein CASPARIAN STRIP INTEGRITY FACTOR 1 n=1 Tax=Camellia lanceoleosa TaxID=1840588 RepID=A0ACC0IQB2_9ERIC|nr:Protein CASPARIAN STRIP INTEGRITY FACTOR 1 [Camellia lanceoleosa]
MGVMMLKDISLLFLIISSSLLSTSFAGRRLVNNLAKDVDATTHEEVMTEQVHDKKEGTATTAIIIHERLLRANTKDYGNYDPAPALVKPPFKLIPN